MAFAEMSPEVEQAQGLMDSLREAASNKEYVETKAYARVKNKVESALKGGESGMSDFYVKVAKAFKKSGISRATVDEMRDQIKLVKEGLEGALGLVESVKELLAAGKKDELEKAA